MSLHAFCERSRSPTSRLYRLMTKQDEQRDDGQDDDQRQHAGLRMGRVERAAGGAPAGG